jgi:hypothetical protein
MASEQYTQEFKIAAVTMPGCEIRNASARMMTLNFWVTLNSFG